MQYIEALNEQQWERQPLPENQTLSLNEYQFFHNEKKLCVVNVPTNLLNFHSFLFFFSVLMINICLAIFVPPKILRECYIDISRLVNFNPDPGPIRLHLAVKTAISFFLLIHNDLKDTQKKLFKQSLVFRTVSAFSIVPESVGS